MEKVQIKDKEYTFIFDYKNNDNYRKSFNVLCNRTWEFDYEKWYNSGYWGDKCHLYSLLDNGNVVSHITVSEFETVILGEKKNLFN